MSLPHDSALTAADYPLATSYQDVLRTPTGKVLSDLTMRNVMAGQITAADVRISPDTLRMQAQIAADVGRPQLAENFRRAAELTALPDTRVLEMYNALRPNASSHEQLLTMAAELEQDHHAPLTAELVREAADVYARRDVLAASNENPATGEDDMTTTHEDGG